MPLPPEWSKAHLRSVRLGLADFSLHIARLEKASSTTPRTPHHERVLPFEQLVDVVQILSSEQHELHARLTCLEETRSTACAQPGRADGDPLGPLFDVLESISSELTGFATRLVRLEDAGPRAELKPDFPQASICPRTSDGTACGVRCRRPVGRAVPRA